MKILKVICLWFFVNSVYALPNGFVYLYDFAPTIQQDLRYAGDHNFIGHPITGYDKNAECIVTKDTAVALAKVQKELNKQQLSLKVFDCYRPTMAVAEFMSWSKEVDKQKMKAEFYPRVNKVDFFRLGYVAEKSGHSRGSTVDLTVVPFSAKTEIPYHPGDKLVACYAPYDKRYRDNSIDMGTGFDCMDELAHPFNHGISRVAYKHRMFLRKLMLKYDFVPYEYEWWHFTLKHEPYPNTYFNFPITHS